MIVFGLISSVFDLVTFAALLLVFHAEQPTFQTFWFIVSLLTELAVVLILRTGDRLFAAGPVACCYGPRLWSPPGHSRFRSSDP